MNPKFSLVVSVYNVQAFLRECLDSVLAQTFPDWEVMCIDDGSTDESGIILDEYAANDVRFRVVHQRNAGVCAARNAALDLVTGEWVWFVDGDDAIHPDALKFLSQVTEKYPSVPNVGLLSYVSSLGTYETFSRRQILGSESQLFDQDPVLTSAYRTVRVAGWASIHRRAVIGKTRFQPYNIGEDVLFSLEVFWKDPRVVATKANIYYYRQRGGSLTNKRPSLRSVLDFLETETKCLDLIRANSLMWTRESFADLFDWMQELDFYTFNWLMFRLYPKDIEKCIPLWLELLAESGDMKPLRARFRIFCALIKICPNGRVAYILVRYVDGMFRRLAKLIRRK